MYTYDFCEITDEHINTARANILVNLMQNDNTLENYTHSILHKVLYIENKAFIDRVKHIKKSDIVKVLKEFKRDVLHNALIFLLF